MGGGDSVVENAEGGGDTLAGVRASSCAACSMVARVQERWMRVWGPQRLQTARGASRISIQPIETRCFRAALTLRRSTRKSSAIQDALHQPPLIQQRSR